MRVPDKLEKLGTLKARSRREPGGQLAERVFPYKVVLTKPTPQTWGCSPIDGVRQKCSYFRRTVMMCMSRSATNSVAMGYPLKQTCADSACLAIREVQKGNTFFTHRYPAAFTNGVRRSRWIRPDCRSYFSLEVVGHALATLAEGRNE